MKIFETFETSCQNLSNSLCQFWNDESIPPQILYPSSVSWRITPLHFFGSNNIYFAHKEPIKVKIFETFERSGQNLSNPNRQILVPRTSRGRPRPTYPGCPLKILFHHPGDVSIWCYGDVLKWRLGDTLIWCSGDAPGRLIRNVPRTFSGRPLEDLQSTRTWMSQIFFNFSFRNFSIDQI